MRDWSASARPSGRRREAAPQGFPALDVCAFLRDWKAAKWDTSGRFEASWFARHGYSSGDALGASFGAPVHAVATKALVAAGAPQAAAQRFTQLAEVYVAGG